MSSSPGRQGLKFWLNAWLPVAIAVGIISLESTQWLGSDHTSHPLRWFWEAIFGPVGDARWQIIHVLFRKLGHFLGYGALGLAWLRAWWMTLPHSHFFKDAVLALLGTALVACADEFHQGFLPNRMGSPLDVLLDCSGAIALQFTLYLFLRIFRPKKLAHED